MTFVNQTEVASLKLQAHGCKNHQATRSKTSWRCDSRGPNSRQHLRTVAMFLTTQLQWNVPHYYSNNESLPDQSGHVVFIELSYQCVISNYLITVKIINYITQYLTTYSFPSFQMCSSVYWHYGNSIYSLTDDRLQESFEIKWCRYPVSSKEN